jgi:hypothetical protein
MVLAPATPRRSRHGIPVLAFSMLGLAAVACDADCDDPGRISGNYAVFHDVLNVKGTPSTGGDTGDGDTGDGDTGDGDTGDGDTGDGDTGDTGTANADDKAEGASGTGTAGDNATADNYDGLSYSTLINGWTQWDLTWSPTTGKLSVTAADSKEVMGDPGEALPTTFSWSGTLDADPTNCNAFTLTLAQAQWVTRSATTHTFSYEAHLLWTGEGMSGTYTYTDTYTEGDSTEPAGGLTNAKGEVYFVLQTDGAFDTGFRE